MQSSDGQSTPILEDVVFADSNLFGGCHGYVYFSRLPKHSFSSMGAGLLLFYFSYIFYAVGIGINRMNGSSTYCS